MKPPIVTPNEIAEVLKERGGSIAERIKLLASIIDFELIKGDSNFVTSDRIMSLTGFKTKYDLAIALHEFAHFVLRHFDTVGNFVQQECEADIFADAVIDILYKNGGYLFGGTLQENETYHGKLNKKQLFDFCEIYGIKKPDIDATIRLNNFFTKIKPCQENQKSLFSAMFLKLLKILVFSLILKKLFTFYSHFLKNGMIFKTTKEKKAVVREIATHGGIAAWVRTFHFRYLQKKMQLNSRGMKSSIPYFP